MYPVNVKSIAIILLVLASYNARVIATELSETEREQYKELGRQHETAWDLYQTLVKRADGGQTNPSFDSLPDWTGVYGRTKGALAFDPDGPPQADALPTAKFTPEYHAKLLKAFEDLKNGIEYDPLSQCVPPGYPRWLDVPFLREFVVRPDQTTMIAEAFNSVRRIYTDGRDHLHEDYQYPEENGDSVGVWDGKKLITHTNMLMAHMYERSQGFYSDQVEGVEIWQKVSDRELVAYVWIYDPPALEEPWFTRQSYTILTDPDKVIRIGHWECKGNQNNDVIKTEDGGSIHTDFTFD
jgi:hypothetical protein